jgi:hypothetical protein
VSGDQTTAEIMTSEMNTSRNKIFTDKARSGVFATVSGALVSFQNYHSIESWPSSASYSGTNPAASIFRYTGNTRRLLITTS